MLEETIHYEWLNKVGIWYQHKRPSILLTCEHGIQLLIFYADLEFDWSLCYDGVSMWCCDVSMCFLSSCHYGNILVHNKLVDAHIYALIIDSLVTGARSNIQQT